MKVATGVRQPISEFKIIDFDIYEGDIMNSESPEGGN